MRRIVGVLVAGALVASLTVPAQAAGCARLSWGTCDPWVENRSFGSAGSYLLVCSVDGSGDANVGRDFQIRIRHLTSSGANSPVGDAWRFDDSGCQTGAQLTITSAALGSSCPAFQGGNPLTITQYALDVDGSTTLRLTTAYDGFTPSSSSRYALWRVVFQHSYSSAGPTPADHSTCGGVDLCENFSLDFAQILGLSGQTILLGLCDSDMSSGAPAGTLATWNGGCATGGPPEATTWGRLKGAYR